MPSQPNSLFPSPGRHNAIGFGARLSAIALLVTLLAGCDNSAAKNAAPRRLPSARRVVIKPISQWDTFNGRIEAVQSVQLRPRVSGYIDKVNYTEGDEVKKGQVLFTIDDRTYQRRARTRSGRTGAGTQPGRAGAQRIQPYREADWQPGDFDRGMGTTSLLRRTGTEQRLAAQAQFDMAQLNLDFTRVIAPIDGRASRAMITAGNLVTAGDSASVLTTLVSLDKVYVYFDVDEATFLRYQNDGRRTA
jgi:membrane fusion protein, multidrug efflux system